MEKIVEIGDIIILRYDDSKEPKVFKLVDKPIFGTTIPTPTESSPLGILIKGKKEGAEGNLTIRNKIVAVTILKILKPNEQDKLDEILIELSEQKDKPLVLEKTFPKVSENRLSQ